VIGVDHRAGRTVIVVEGKPVTAAEAVAAMREMAEALR